MAKQDYYETLGINRSASPEEVKRAYRQLAMKYHPDRNSGDKQAEQRFKEISEAYDVLKDSQKRAAYDRFGHAAFDNGGAGRHPGFDFNFGAGFADIFDEMFGEFMGTRRRGTGVLRGADLRYNLEINLEDAFKGREARIRVPTAVTCDACGGTGGAGGARSVACQTCSGYGRVRAQQGFFTIERTCPACQGIGRVIEDPCPDCRGSGRVQKEKTLSVNIPPGVEDGTRIRLAGEGEAGVRGGPPGDLYIFLTVRPHSLFRRDGANVLCRVPIPMTTAALGGNIEVPTLDGSRARISIPSGTQTGRQFRLRHKGMPVLRSAARGDMFVEAMVETPVNLTARQKELLREFGQAGGGRSQSPESDGFFTKVRELWEDLKD